MLTESAELDSNLVVTETRTGADAVLRIQPPWPDHEAPDRHLKPRDMTRIFLFDQTDDPVLWAPGAFASAPTSKATSAITGGFYIHEHQRDPDGVGPRLEAARSLPVDLLWSFAGSVENHPLRREIVEVASATSDGMAVNTQRFNDVLRWGWRKQHREEAQKAFSSYASSIGRAHFVICPRGVGPGSMRLFEAMQVGRCPVIVSDEWTPPAVVDWSRCSLRIPESRVSDIPQILESHRADASKLGKEARVAWEQFFAPHRQLATLLRLCAEVDGSMSARIGCFTSAGGARDIPIYAARSLKHRLQGQG